MANSLKKFIKLYFFNRKWRKINKQNYTTAGTIFPIDKVSIGEMTYGHLNIFSWGDDSEYTLRIRSKNYVGVYVRKSKVTHKTKINYSANDNIIDCPKHFYGARNNLYIKRQKGFFNFLIHFTFEFLNTFHINKNLRISHLKGLFASLFFNPKIDYVKDDKH